MALFAGEQLVDIVTPDGRTMKIPASIAQGFQGLQQQVPTSGLPQANAMPVAQPPTAADVPPDSVTGGRLPTQPDPYAAPTTDMPRGEDFVVPDPTVAAKAGAPARAARAKNEAVQAKARAAYAASPQGKQEEADRQTQAAIEAEKVATEHQANIDAAAQDLTGNAAAEHNQKIDDLFNQRAVNARANLDAEQNKNEEIGALRKKIASTKINREADHPIVAALMIGLAGLGAAMQNPNQPPPTTALELFWKAIDRKVANQMGDLDLMEKDYGMAKDELSSLKGMSDRKLELYNTLLAGEADKAKRHLEEIIGKSASEKTRANAQVLMAQIDQRAAAAHNDATRWGLEYDQRDTHQKQQLGLGYAQLGESRRSNMANEELKREDMYLDSQKYLAGLKAKGDEEAYKASLKQTEEVSKRGIRDSNADLLLMPQAKAMLEQAKQLEEEAAKTEEVGKADPLTFGIKGGKQRVEMLRERAAQMRGEANNNAVLGFNDTDAKDVSNLLAAGQGTVQLIDRIKALSDQAGRGVISRTDAQAQLQSMFNQLGPNLKEAWQLGAWDKGSASLVQSIIGQDPSSEWNSGVLSGIVSQKMFNDAEAFKGQLDSVANGLEDRAKNTLAHRGAKFEKNQRVLQRLETPDTNTPSAKAAGALSGSTPLGSAESTAASEGPAARVVDTLTIGKGPLATREDEAKKIENSGSLSRVGLTDKQAAGFDTLLQSYKGGNAADGDQIVASVSNAATKQPDLAKALLHNLREHAPDLYVKARAAVPKDSDVDKQMNYEETQRVGSALNDTKHLAAMVYNTIDKHGKITNQEDWGELARRAQAGDKDAKKGILDIVNQSGFIKSLPAGSVFKGNR